MKRSFLKGAPFRLENPMKNIVMTRKAGIKNAMVEVFIHGQNVSIISTKIALNLGISDKELHIISAAAALHDIGKKDVPLEILDKPGKLTGDEMIEMRKHTLYGFNALVKDKRFNNLANYILYHHEDCRGMGYYRLKENEIPLASKIIMAADVFDALTSDRAYRSAFSMKEALDIMENEQQKYDKKVFNELKKIIKEEKFFKHIDYTYNTY